MSLQQSVQLNFYYAILIGKIYKYRLTISNKQGVQRTACQYRFQSEVDTDSKGTIRKLRSANWTSYTKQ